MKRRWIWALPLLLFVGLVGLFAAGLGKDPRVLPSQRLDQPAPGFSLPLLGEPGRTFSPEQMRGQVWLLNVWASWCTACRAEHEVVKSLASEYQVAVVGLNQQDAPQDAQAWLAEMGDPYLLSAVDADGRVSIDYGVYGVPETFVIDREGMIRYRHLGPLTGQSVREVLLPLIRKLES